MNDRFVKLAVQAYQWAENESKGGPNMCVPGSDYFLAMEQKKFAELIVRECAMVADMNAVEAMGLYGKVLEHFGVEE